MTYAEQLRITLLDKGLLALLILVAGFFINRLLEVYKREQATLLEAFKSQQNLALESFRSQRSLENELEKLRDAKRLGFLERQLSEFYWPLFMRLSIDNAVWSRILDAKHGSDETRRKVGQEIERMVILPNHEEIVRILQSSIFLAESSEADVDLMLQYIRHVAVYRALRASGVNDKYPLELGEPWPDQFYSRVRDTAFALQAEYEAAVRSLKARENGAAPTGAPT